LGFVNAAAIAPFAALVASGASVGSNQLLTQFVIRVFEDGRLGLGSRSQAEKKHGSQSANAPN
jgi:hypothetical protein